MKTQTPAVLGRQRDPRLVELLRIKRNFLPILALLTLLVIISISYSFTLNVQHLHLTAFAATAPQSNNVTTTTITIIAGDKNDKYDSTGNPILHPKVLDPHHKYIALNSKANSKTAELPVGTRIELLFQGQSTVTITPAKGIVERPAGKYKFPQGVIGIYEVVGPGTVHIRVDNKIAYTSGNWSGYVQPGSVGSYTQASSYWFAPTPATCTGSASTSATFWVGIDGDAQVQPGNTTVLQVGTDNTCDSSNNPGTYAWWEYAPFDYFTIGPGTQTCTPTSLNCGNVSNGDLMYGNVNYNPSSSNWTLTLNNLTQNWYFTTTQTYTGSQSAAEAIAEDDNGLPDGSLGPMTNYNTVTFSNSLFNGINPNFNYLTQSWQITGTSYPSNPNSIGDGFSVGYGSTPLTPDSWKDISQGVPSPGMRMFGVTAVSPTNVWVVGMGGTGPAPRAYEYNGTSWTAHNPSAISGQANNLFGATSDNSGNVWAVGEWYASPNLDTLVYKWSGSSWAWKSSYNPSSNWENRLNAVSTDNSGDVYAVGYADVTSFSDIQPLIEKWNGTSFVNVPISKPTGCTNAALYGVSVYSSTNIWASGQAYCGTSGNVYVIYHYDGTNWTSTLGSTSPGSISSSILYGIKAVSSTEAWAVGQKTWVTGSTYALHTTNTGSTWTEDTNASMSGQLKGIDADSPTDIWSLSGGTWELHYDGSNWSKINLPSLHSGTGLNGIAVNSNIGYLAGYYLGSDYVPVELRSY